MLLLLIYPLDSQWQWLTKGQNATALATAVNVIIAIVLIATLVAVIRQAKASDRQAKAAEKQVKAAEDASAVSDALRKAAEESAAAQREQSELIRKQLQAALLPTLVLTTKSHMNRPDVIDDVVENQGAGVALDVQVTCQRDRKCKGLGLNIIGPGKSSRVNLEQNDKSSVLVISCRSLDGRNFSTTVERNGDGLPVQTTTGQV
jgi:hypothetical protein